MFVVEPKGADDDTKEDAAKNGKSTIPNLKDLIEWTASKFSCPVADNIPNTGANDARNKTENQSGREEFVFLEGLI